MKKASTILRLSVSLTLLTVSILLVGKLLGLLPDRTGELVRSRATITENLAIQLSALATRNDEETIRVLLREFVERNDSVRSAAFKDHRGVPIAMFGDHARNWNSDQAADTPMTHMSVPIYRSSRLWGSVEVRYEPVWGRGLAGFLVDSSLALYLFVGISGLFLYYFMLQRGLRELNPSRVIPDRVRSAFDVLAEGVLILDHRGCVVLANSSIAGRLNCSPESLVGKDAANLPFTCRAPGETAPWLKALEEGQRCNNVAMELVNDTGEQYVFSVNAAPIANANGRSRGTLATFDDLSQVERKNQQLSLTLDELKVSREKISEKNRELENLAMRDPLTGCHNRRYLLDRFEAIFADPGVDRRSVTCFMIDIDHFKHVNDRYGHAVGDQVIKQVGEALMAHSRAEDILGRYGGEEFCLVSLGLSEVQQHDVAERLRRAIAGLCSGSDAAFPVMRVTASIGFASATAEHQGPMDLISDADAALYRSKEAGRNRVSRFDRDRPATGTPGPSSANVVYLDGGKVAPSERERETDDTVPAGHQELISLRERVKELEELALRRQDELRHTKLYDGLTKLPNRVLLLDRASQDVKRVPRYGRVVAAISIEIETLNRVNDTLGHQAADELLKVVAARLRDVLRAADMVSPTSSTLARIGSNELAALIGDLTGYEAVNKIVRQAMESLAEPIRIEDDELYVSSNFGVGLYPHDAATAEELIRNASAARLQAKLLGKRVNVAYYSKEINHSTTRRIRIEALLHQAIRLEQFAVHYQPKVRLDTGRYCGMEALLRWHSPDLGDVSPAEFIPIAEEAGLMPDISNWVLRTICQQIKRWQPLGLSNFRVAVNVSALELRDPELAGRMLALLEEEAVSPRFLEIEITETAVMDSLATAVNSLKQLEDAGVELAIDDFGTGYSSLSHLTALPLHVLKIDGCFVRDIDVNSGNQAIVRAIVALARTSGLRLLAEGVETQAELAWLRHSGCDEVQGYVCSRPMSAPSMTALLIENNERAELQPPAPEKRFWRRLLSPREAG